MVTIKLLLSVTGAVFGNDDAPFLGKEGISPVVRGEGVLSPRVLPTTAAQHASDVVIVFAGWLIFVVLLFSFLLLLSPLLSLLHTEW